ncbi:MAG: terpene cyclase/mutase family protein [Phycisphaerales bacterium]|nr:terpene cyclase/mutase family protein [Phycisphaerales bacterium]
MSAGHANFAGRAAAIAITAASLTGFAQPVPPTSERPTPTTPIPSSTQPAPPPPPENESRLPNSAQNNAAADEITPELTAAVQKGLAALATKQQDDGSFGGDRLVARGLEHILQNCAESGLIATDATTGPMYGHGFAALFLGEVYGMTAGGGDTALNARVHSALVKAVRLIQATQNSQGGWRYNPIPYDADVSVTICQVMALRSARNAGLEVPKETIDNAVEYIRRCQNDDGGFRYQMDQGDSLWPRSAAGVASLFYAGIYSDAAIDKGLRYVTASAFPGRNDSSRAHYFYGHYYAVQTMYLAGGQHWAEWWPAIRKELLDNQQPDGTWNDPSIGDTYGTAMSLIILQMPKRYLPIFQK